MIFLKVFHLQSIGSILLFEIAAVNNITRMEKTQSMRKNCDWMRYENAQKWQLEQAPGETRWKDWKQYIVVQDELMLTRIDRFVLMK